MKKIGKDDGLILVLIIATLFYGVLNLFAPAAIVSDLQAAIPQETPIYESTEGIGDVGIQRVISNGLERLMDCGQRIMNGESCDEMPEKPGGGSFPGPRGMNP